MSSNNQTENQATAEKTNPRDFKTLLDKASEKTIKAATKPDENSGGLLEKGHNPNLLLTDAGTDTAPSEPIRSRISQQDAR